jgi:hypothetical protein
VLVDIRFQNFRYFSDQGVPLRERCIAIGSMPEEFATYVASEFQRWGELAKEAGLRVQ